MVGNVLSLRPAITMDDFDLVSALWELLLTQPGAKSADDLAKATGAEPAPVRTALARLRQAGLIAQEGDQPRTYVGRRSLDALAWARAVDLGININLLESLADYETKDRRLALQLATDGEVERIQAAEAKEKRDDRDARRRRKIKSQVAATELGQLVADAMESLRKQRQKKDLDPVSKSALELLSQTIAEGQHALESLQRNMLRD